MRFRRSLLLSCLVALLSPSSPSTLFAAETVSPGQKVRVTYQPNSSAQGTLVSSGTDSIVVNRDGAAGAITIPIDAIERVQRYDGKKGNWAWGLLIGAAAGTAVGLILKDDVPSSSEPLDDAYSQGVVIARSVFVGAAAGTLVGALIKTDRWKTVPVESLSISAGANPDGDVSLILSVHF